MHGHDAGNPPAEPGREAPSGDLRAHTGQSSPGAHIYRQTAFEKRCNSFRPALSQPITAQLADLEQQLEERLHAVNQRIASGENAHVRITRRGRGPTVRWTLSHPRATPTMNHALFDALPPRDIGSIVHFVDRRCPFLHHVDHLLPRFAKRRADARVLRACLVAWGINMGLHRMRETSDLSSQALQDTSDNVVRLETLGPANDCIANGIVALPITHHYDLGGLVHSSSDGQKFETRRPTINARHGVKYVGLQKGVVSYSLVANHVPVNARIIGAHEHESHYVFDLLFNNTTTLRPIRKVNTELIIEEWDNILRIFVSLAQKTTSQSIIVGKLSSYTWRNKTQRALWEYDAILRSLYLLDFIDSPPLRQHLQHALSRGENYHHLRRALAYANVGKLRFRSEEEQQIWNECSRLLANCIIYFNATILSELLAHAHKEASICLGMYMLCGVY